MRYYYNFYPKAYMLLYKNAFHYIIEKADVPIGIEFLQLVSLVLLDQSRSLMVQAKLPIWKFEREGERMDIGRFDSLNYYSCI